MKTPYAEAKTFTITPDERTHDESGRGLEMGKYWVRCFLGGWFNSAGVYVSGRYSGSVLVQPDIAYEHAKRMMLGGWVPQDDATRAFVDGMANVEHAFEEDAKRAHLYDEHGRLKEGN